MIRAITFDLWDTLVIDNSDEPKRASAGQLPKPQAREALFVDEVLAHHPDLSKDRVTAAFEQCNTNFRQQWKVEHRTPHIRDRLADGFAILGLSPTPGFDALVHAFSRMEVDFPPNLVPGIHETLASLSGNYRLGIISDAIVTPGADLRDLLDVHGIRDAFEVFVFSDEAGAAKPNPKVFQIAAEALSTPLDALVHVGDRESNDIVGPIEAGAHGILYTGAVDRGSANSRADAICHHHRELPAIVAAL